VKPGDKGAARTEIKKENSLQFREVPTAGSVLFINMHTWYNSKYKNAVDTFRAASTYQSQYSGA
jgi:hypothetical protein